MLSLCVLSVVCVVGLVGATPIDSINQQALISSVLSQNPAPIPATVLFTGLISDGKGSINSLFKDLSEVACVFRDAHLIIQENNSQDTLLADTLALVQAEQIDCPNANQRTQAKPFNTRKGIEGKDYASFTVMDRASASFGDLQDYLIKNPVPGVDRIFVLNYNIPAFDSRSFGLNATEYMKWDAVCFNDNNADSASIVTTDGAWAFDPSFRDQATKVGYADIKKILSSTPASEPVLRLKSCFNAGVLYKADKYLAASCKYQSTADALAAHPELDGYLTKGVVELNGHIPFHSCLATVGGDFKMGVTTIQNYINTQEMVMPAPMDQAMATPQASPTAPAPAPAALVQQVAPADQMQPAPVSAPAPVTQMTMSQSAAPQTVTPMTAAVAPAAAPAAAPAVEPMTMSQTPVDPMQAAPAPAVTQMTMSQAPAAAPQTVMPQQAQPKTMSHTPADHMQVAAPVPQAATPMTMTQAPSVSQQQAEPVDTLPAL